MPKSLQTRVLVNNSPLSANADHLYLRAMASFPSSFTLDEIIFSTHRSKNVCRQALTELIQSSLIEKLPQIHDGSGRFTSVRYRVTATSLQTSETCPEQPVKNLDGDSCIYNTTIPNAFKTKAMKDHVQEPAIGEKLTFDFTPEEQKMLDSYQENYPNLFSIPDVFILLDQRMKKLHEARPNVAALFAHTIYASLKQARIPTAYIKANFLKPEWAESGCPHTHFGTSAIEYQDALEMLGISTKLDLPLLNKPKAQSKEKPYQKKTEYLYHGDRPGVDVSMTGEMMQYPQKWLTVYNELNPEDTLEEWIKLQGVTNPQDRQKILAKMSPQKELKSRELLTLVNAAFQDSEEKTQKSSHPNTPIAKGSRRIEQLHQQAKALFS